MVADKLETKWSWEGVRGEGEVVRHATNVIAQTTAYNNSKRVLPFRTSRSLRRVSWCMHLRANAVCCREAGHWHPFSNPRTSFNCSSSSVSSLFMLSDVSSPLLISRINWSISFLAYFQEQPNQHQDNASFSHTSSCVQIDLIRRVSCRLSVVVSQSAYRTYSSPCHAVSPPLVNSFTIRSTTLSSSTRLIEHVFAVLYPSFLSRSLSSSLQSSTLV